MFDWGACALSSVEFVSLNKYLVLSLEFSRINTQNETSTFDGFLSNVKSGVDLFLTEYQSFFTESDISEILNNEQPSEVIKALFSCHQKRNVPHPIYILIDEYDHFANELISFNFDNNLKESFPFLALFSISTLRSLLVAAITRTSRGRRTRPISRLWTRFRAH